MLLVEHHQAKAKDFALGTLIRALRSILALAWFCSKPLGERAISTQQRIQQKLEILY